MEDKIIAYLADDLTKALSQQDGKLHFKERLSKDLELFTPRYLCAVEDDPIDAPQEPFAVLAPAEGTDSEAAPDALVPSKVSFSNTLLADDNIKEEIDDEAVRSLKDDPTITDNQQDKEQNRSRETAQPDTSLPPPQPHPPKTQIEHGSHNTTNLTINYNGLHINIRQYWWAVLILVVLLVFGLLAWHYNTPFSPQGKIEVSEDQVAFDPRGVYQLVPFFLTDDISDKPFEYSSSNPDILSVSPEGYVTASYGLKEDISVEVKISLGDVKKIVTFSIETDDIGSEFTPIDLDNFEPGYTIGMQARLAGTKEWLTTVDAEIGDIVEFQLEYRNTSAATQNNVMVRAILPQSLRYVPNTTKLWSANHNGATFSTDTITTTAVNIGHYASNANA